METVRYAARATQVNREIEAKKADIWSQAVTAVYETDPEIVAAILPPPLRPGPAPLVRVTITRVEMPGLPVFGAGWIGVQARHEDRLGEYPIFMPMTTEQSLIGGREINGEPKKLAEVELDRQGDQVSARIARMGSVVCEVTGRVTGTPRQLRDGEDGLLVQALALVRSGRGARPGPAPRLRREDRADARPRDD